MDGPSTRVQQQFSVGVRCLHDAEPSQARRRLARVLSNGSMVDRSILRECLVTMVLYAAGAVTPDALFSDPLDGFI